MPKRHHDTIELDSDLDDPRKKRNRLVMKTINLDDIPNPVGQLPKLNSSHIVSILSLFNIQDCVWSIEGFKNRYKEVYEKSGKSGKYMPTRTPSLVGIINVIGHWVLVEVDYAKSKISISDPMKNLYTKTRTFASDLKNEQDIFKVDTNVLGYQDEDDGWRCGYYCTYAILVYKLTYHIWYEKEDECKQCMMSTDEGVECFLYKIAKVLMDEKDLHQIQTYWLKNAIFKSNLAPPPQTRSLLKEDFAKDKTIVITQFVDLQLRGGDGDLPPSSSSERDDDAEHDDANLGPSSPGYSSPDDFSHTDDGSSSPGGFSHTDSEHDDDDGTSSPDYYSPTDSEHDDDDGSSSPDYYSPTDSEHDDDGDDGESLSSQLQQPQEPQAHVAPVVPVAVPVVPVAVPVVPVVAVVAAPPATPSTLICDLKKKLKKKKQKQETLQFKKQKSRTNCKDILSIYFKMPWADKDKLDAIENIIETQGNIIFRQQGYPKVTYSVEGVTRKLTLTKGYQPYNFPTVNGSSFDAHLLDNTAFGINTNDLVCSRVSATEVEIVSGATTALIQGQKYQLVVGKDPMSSSVCVEKNSMCIFVSILPSICTNRARRCAIRRNLIKLFDRVSDIIRKQYKKERTFFYGFNMYYSPYIQKRQTESQLIDRNIWW